MHKYLEILHFQSHILQKSKMLRILANNIKTLRICEDENVEVQGLSAQSIMLKLSEHCELYYDNLLSIVHSP